MLAWYSITHTLNVESTAVLPGALWGNPGKSQCPATVPWNEGGEKRCGLVIAHAQVPREQENMYSRSEASERLSRCPFLPNARL